MERETKLSDLRASTDSEWTLVCLLLSPLHPFSSRSNRTLKTSNCSLFAQLIKALENLVSRLSNIFEPNYITELNSIYSIIPVKRINDRLNNDNYRYYLIENTNV